MRIFSFEFWRSEIKIVFLANRIWYYVRVISNPHVNFFLSDGETFVRPIFFLADVHFVGKSLLVTDIFLSSEFNSLWRNL